MKMFFLILLAAHAALWLICKTKSKPRNAEQTMEDGFGLTVLTILIIAADVIFIITGVVRWLIHA